MSTYISKKWNLNFSFCLSVCRHVCACVGECAYAEARAGHHQLSPLLLSALLPWDRVSHRITSSFYCQPLGISLSSLHSAAVTNIRSHAWILCGFWGFKVRCSCLQSKCSHPQSPSFLSQKWRLWRLISGRSTVTLTGCIHSNKKFSYIRRRTEGELVPHAQGL